MKCDDEKFRYAVILLARTKIRMGSCKVIFLEGIEKSDDVTGETTGDRSRLLPVIQKFRYAVILLARTKNPYGKL